AEDDGREAAARAAVPVHELHFPHLVTRLSDPGEQAHFLGDVVAHPPEVDDVTPAAKLWRLLDQQHLVTGFPQPVGQRRTGDARPADGNPHARLARAQRTRSPARPRYQPATLHAEQRESS